MTCLNSLALLAALWMYLLSQIVVAGAPVTDLTESSAFATMKAELLDEAAAGEFVEAVQKFAPAKSPCTSQ